jgi:hypothetical protein
MVLTDENRHPANQYIKKLRRRSKLAQNNRKIFADAFGNHVVKLLGIPMMIDDYNCHKSEVDRFDQVKSYYSVQQVKQRTWRPLFYFLLDLTLNNTYRMSSYASAAGAKQSGHKKFLYKLIEQLFERGSRLCRGSNKRQRADNLIVSDEGDHKAIRMYGDAKTCVACAESGRKTNRAPLHATSGNSHGRQRPPRTVYGCQLCKLPLCRPEQRPKCWQEHLQRHQTIKHVDTLTSSSFK